MHAKIPTAAKAETVHYEASGPEPPSTVQFCHCSPRMAQWSAMATKLQQELDTFANPQPDRDYSLHIRIPEFTCLCPKTGQPDFATLRFDYVPDQRCVELKSLKQYIRCYRDVGAFHEDVANRILSDLIGALEPRFARLTAEFNVRGGIYTTVVAEHRQDGWQPPQPVHLP